MGVREQQKQATRAKVLDAARDLFDSAGYEETTIRAIAERAGVSVGSVFTTFASKAEILGQIMNERIEQLSAELEKVVPNLRGSIVDRMSSLIAIHYDFQMRRPKLYLAYLSVSFHVQRASGFVRMGASPALRAPMRDLLAAAIERGEVRADLDIELALDMLVSLYGFNYLRVAEGADAKELSEILDRELKAVFEGLAAR
ncbi:MAG: TetR/AcrR family transcriptional regulator [Parcubacteria group bacterium]